MVKVEENTNKNKLPSSKIVNARFSGDKIKIAERYCANAIIGILYPLTTENRLKTFEMKSLFLRLSIANYLLLKINNLELVNHF